MAATAECGGGGEKRRGASGVSGVSLFRRARKLRPSAAPPPPLQPVQVVPGLLHHGIQQVQRLHQGGFLWVDSPACRLLLPWILRKRRLGLRKEILPSDTPCNLPFPPGLPEDLGVGGQEVPRTPCAFLMV